MAGAQVTLEIRQGQERSQHQVDLSRNRHWDHAYAQTVHASQGSTQHRTLFHIRAPQTEDERQQDKTSAIETIQRHQKSTTHEAERGLQR